MSAPDESGAAGVRRASGPLDFAELDRMLRESVADGVLDDDEKFELRQLGDGLPRDRIRYLRNRAFALVRDRLGASPSAQVPAHAPAPAPAAIDLLRWLEQVVRTLDAGSDPPAVEAQAFFAPGDDCLRKLRELCLGAERSIDVCVYTISDDRLCVALIDAHRRGVAVRIVSDDHKAHDAGSDILRLRDFGLEVRLDDTEFHMHHKFALFDRNRLATGSFNWTRSASVGNEENLVVTDDARLVGRFAERFDRLWAKFGRD